ncbi:DNA polymerase III subunit chi [Leptothrix ochracea]|uniref:DNA polymerase III subunit chi n=1 Tax=Leptothrix ochracea TaxID=735331 RepID=UPI0034E1E7F8
MATVAFHFNVAHRNDYLCRLIRKAHRLGAWLCVTAPAVRLDELDRLLWTFDPLSFVPHQRVRSAPPSPLVGAPVWVQLAETPRPREPAEVLVNESGQVIAETAGFAKVIEVVGHAEADRQAARARWRAYAEAGWTLERFEVKA